VHDDLHGKRDDLGCLEEVQGWVLKGEE